MRHAWKFVLGCVALWRAICFWRSFEIKLQSDKIACSSQNKDRQLTSAFIFQFCLLLRYRCPVCLLWCPPCFRQWECHRLLVLCLPCQDRPHLCPPVMDLKHQTLKVVPPQLDHYQTFHLLLIVGEDAPPGLHLQIWCLMEVHRWAWVSKGEFICLW